MIGGIVIRGMEGSGRLRAFGAVARDLGQGILLIDCPGPKHLSELCRLAGPLAYLLSAIPAIKLELTAGELVEIPALPGYRGPLIVILREEGSVRGRAVESCVTLHIPPATAAVRRRYWQKSFMPDETVQISPTMLQRISDRFHLTIGGIEKAAPLAQAYALLEGRAEIELQDAQAACRSLNRQSLDALATQMDVQGCDWESLVVPHTTRVEFENLLLRCRQREAVLPHLGSGFGTHNRGVRALLSGPSGTGKTLAVRVLVAELGLDLYRVDLAAVVNKYIGETERNLSRLFARAEEQDIVLLFDEGDSFLTGRTEVRSSNDRYANMETNYLLQRLESYQGILLITTNSPGRIDSAFQRRMDAVLDFSMPDVEQRRLIWSLHLPPAHQVGNDFLQMVARRCQLNGGQIRNAALHATVLAVEYDSVVTAEFVTTAVAREYNKMGATVPLIPVPG